MSQDTIKVVAHIRAKAGREEELKEVLLSLLVPTRKETGCREYRLYENSQDRSELTFVEEWDSDAALDAHLKTPHVQASLSKVPELADGAPDIRRYRLIG